MHFNTFHFRGVMMGGLQDQAAMKKSSLPASAPAKSPKAKFRVFGEELIEKQVKSSGNSGRVYLPLEWVGKHVKIIRID